MSPDGHAPNPGAFRFGLRLMAIDGTVEDLPDTPENAAVFGCHHSDRGWLTDKTPTLLFSGGFLVLTSDSV